MMGYEERARRRGAITMRLFLEEMGKLGFVERENPREGVLHEFMHRETGRIYEMPFGQTYSGMLVKFREQLVAEREAGHVVDAI